MPGCQRNVADSSTLCETHDNALPYATNGWSMSVVGDRVRVKHNPWSLDSAASLRALKDQARV